MGLDKKVKLTPLMKQYNQIKVKYPDALLLFRVGDFYETFGQDAVTAAKILGIILTKRGAGSTSETELAGFPHHSINTYLPKLVRAGCRVAICDQLEDPKMTKKIVKRGVTELITPGLSLSDDVLDSRKNNFLASLFFGKKIALALLDISTGEFFVTQGDITYINKTISKIPLLGKILVGDKTGEGVFGVSFKIKGPPKDLETTVNPIKTLTPRFITRTLEKIKKN